MASFGNPFDKDATPLLSDAVIGSVHTRARGPGYGLIRPIPRAKMNSTSLPPLKMLSPLANAVTSAAAERFPQCVDQLTPENPPVSRSVPVHLPSLQSAGAFVSPSRIVSDAVATLSIASSEAATPSRLRRQRPTAKSEACREQCRNNQARYRQKQREYVANLEATVAQLRDDIPRLEVERRRLNYDSRQRAWDVVTEYFQHFRNGVGGNVEQGSTAFNEASRASEAQQQLMFLRSTMANNVEFGDLSGIEVLLDQWRQMSEGHEDLHFELQHMKKISDCIVIASATLSVTVTKCTLECIFSHLMNSETVEDLSLAVKLLGQRVSYPCSVLFVWDEATNLVARLETEVDMATPLIELLGNVQEASRILEGAIMFSNGQIN